MMHSMGARNSAAATGAADAWRLAAEAGREVRSARRSAGVSQRAVAARSGVSRTQLGRLERGELRSPPFALICRAARVVGLAASLKLYPAGPGLRREAGLPMPGDRRAWDQRLTDGVRSASVECELHLQDVQDVQRRITLKVRDDPGVGVVILVVADTRHNRRVLAEHREALRAQFPLDGGAIIRALRAGRIPPASGVVLL
jgi:transcriptional regulator with XRE-family HTH domain